MIQYHIFWQYKAQTNTMQIIACDLYKFLSINGFKYHTLGETGVQKPVEVEGKFIILRKMTDIKKFTIDAIKHADEDLELTPSDQDLIINALVTKKELFHEENLLFLEEYNPLIVKDTKEVSYVFFKNNYCEITKDEIKVKPYSELNGAIYYSQVIDFYIDDTILISDYMSSDFYDFIELICSDSVFDINEKAVKSLMSIIGYLMHTHKNPAINKAVILMDADNRINPDGRTGKTLLAQAIGKIRKIAFEDGKWFKFNDKFSFSLVNWETQIIVMDDVSKSFDFEKFFPAITSGITVEEKFVNKYRIPPELSPKIIVTTNYTIKGEGESHKGRKIEFELSHHFTADHGPEQEYGCRFFDDWEKQDWEQFYQFMMTCIQVYLQNGIIEPPKVNVNLKRLLQEVGPDFITVMDENVILNQRYDKKEIFEIYTSKYPYQVGITQRTFTSWVKLYAVVKGFKITESHSNDVEYFILSQE
jgi:hypothetical protein